MITRASNSACALFARGLVALVFAADRTFARKQGA